MTSVHNPQGCAQDGREAWSHEGEVCTDCGSWVQGGANVLVMAEHVARHEEQGRLPWF